MAVRSSLLSRRTGVCMFVVVLLWLALVTIGSLRASGADSGQQRILGLSLGRHLLQLPTPPEENASVTQDEDWSSGSGSGSNSNEEESGPRNCTAPALNEFPEDLLSRKQRRHGGALLHAVAAAYLFLLMAVICHDYFVPSIKVLCARLELPEDVAGATFMAAATSCPELFINGVGTFITEGDLGIGTVVGSGVFNILVVPACCGLFAGKTVSVSPWPLTRDSVAYASTILLLIAALSDGRVEWYEAVVFVVLYFLYMFTLCIASKPSCRCLRWVCCITGVGEGDRDEDRRTNEESPLLRRVSGVVVKNNGWHHNLIPASTRVVAYDMEEYPEETGVCTPPSGAAFMTFLWWLLLRPIKAVLAVTIPDCRPRRRRKLYLFTLVACITWIAAASYVVAWMITIIGDVLQIPDSVMGLTLLAAGTSLPEAVSSVIVTNQGYGAMGISNSIGSNTFNILLCLGLPWLLKSIFLPPAPGQYWVNFNSGGLLYNTISLLTTLFLLYSAFAYNSFKLNRKVGAITLIMYLAFIAVAFAVELNIFGNVNLPTCPH